MTQTWLTQLTSELGPGISVSLTIGQLFVILYDPEPFSLNKGEHQLSDFVCRVNQDNWQGSGSALLYLRPLVLRTCAGSTKFARQ